MVSIRVALFKDSIQIKITNCVRYIFCSNTVYQLLSSTFRMKKKKIDSKLFLEVVVY